METSDLAINQRIYADLFDHIYDAKELQKYHLLVPRDYLGDLAQALDPPKENSLVFFGSGNFHYLTLPILSHLEGPVTLVVFDHHIDAGDMLFPGMVSCGSWIRDLLDLLGNIDRVYVIGPQLKQYPHKTIPDHIKEKLVVIDESEILENHWQALANQLAGKRIYLSIDRDLLSEVEVETNWDQGGVKSQQLQNYLLASLAGSQLLGADICGDWDWTEQDFLSQVANKRMDLSRLNLTSLMATVEGLF